MKEIPKLTQRDKELMAENAKGFLFVLDSYMEQSSVEERPHVVMGLLLALVCQLLAMGSSKKYSVGAFSELWDIVKASHDDPGGGETPFTN